MTSNDGFVGSYRGSPSTRKYGDPVVFGCLGVTEVGMLELVYQLVQYQG